MKIPVSLLIPTAARKESILDKELSSDWQRAWMDKPIMKWSCEDVVSWLYHIMEDEENIDIESSNIHKFNMEGVKLLQLMERDFLEWDPKYGSILYSALLKMKKQNEEHNLTAHGRVYVDLQPFIQIATSPSLLDTNPKGEDGEIHLIYLQESRMPFRNLNLDTSFESIDRMPSLTLKNEPTSDHSITQDSNNSLTEKKPTFINLESRVIGSYIPTATNKRTVLQDGLSTNWMKEWMKKSVQEWTSEDVMGWITYVLEEEKNLDIEYIQLDKFNVCGKTLWEMTEKDFMDRNEKYGQLLYEALHRGSAKDSQATRLPSFWSLKSSSGQQPLFETMIKSEDLFLHSDVDSQPQKLDSQGKNWKRMTKKETPTLVGVRKKKKTQNHGRVWQFIRNLLHNPEYCPSHIRWENHEEGTFKMVRSKDIAKLWGDCRGNPRMTYEKLSRAMRHYYSSGVFVSVEGQRLVYKFGPKAKNWRSSNPNFQRPEPE